MQKSLAVLLIVPLALAGMLFHTQAQTPQPMTPRVDGKEVKRREGDKLPEQAQPFFFSAYRAMEWLKLTNKPDGRFVYGFQPALRVQLDGDNFQSQAGRHWLWPVPPAISAMAAVRRSPVKLHSRSGVGNDARSQRR